MQAVEPAAVALLAPAEVVVDVPDFVGFGRRQFVAQALFDLLLEMFEAPIGDEVLQSRPLAIAAIAEIAKDADDRAEQIQDLIGAGVGHPLGQGGKGLGPGGRHAHAAAHQHVVADHVIIAAHGQQAHVLAIDIRAIVAWQADAHFEFSRQIGLAVKRLDLAFGFLGTRGRRFVEPDLAISRRPRREGRGNLPGHPLDLPMHRIAAVRRRAADDIAVHVAAGGHRSQADLVNPPEHRTKVLFGKAVHLHVLPAGDSQRAIAELVGKLDMGQKLLAREPSAGHPRADHELVELLLLQARVAQQHAVIAVVLLIHAVMFQQLGRLVREVVGRLGQLFGDLTAQEIALSLDLFHQARLAIDLSLRIVAHDRGGPERIIQSNAR